MSELDFVPSKTPWTFEAGDWSIVATDEALYLMYRGEDMKVWTNDEIERDGVEVGAVEQLAQRIENLLDPPECPTKHTGLTYDEFPSGEPREPYQSPFCPDCGQPLTKES